MGRRAVGSALDISIHGDELEQDRIQLEHNLQHTNLSFRLSSISDDEEHNNSSIEYPRHNSGPATFPEFPSFAHRSGDHDVDEDTHMQAWSYRTVDEEGISPYGGETVSTAAHHASAITLSAGLGGGRGVRREVSLSGAEYDPDRPLQDMIQGIDGKFSILELDPSRSKVSASVTFDPLVVDTTADLDRILQSGHALPLVQSRSVRLRSPISSGSSDTESLQARNPRPKLSDALRSVSFSPKRPRSAQQSPINHPASPLVQFDQSHQPEIITSIKMPTPRPAHRRTSVAMSTQPEVRLQPPTPSTSGSQFARMARDITKEIESEKNNWHTRSKRSKLASTSLRRSQLNSFTEDVQLSRTQSPYVKKATPRTTSRAKVQLPDVTGLTSAVESPAKLGGDYLLYKSRHKMGDSEVHLLQTLSSVQAKLQHLEEENAISRRRVAELEKELVDCKRDVARERTRLVEQEDIITQQEREFGSGKRKGKERANRVSVAHVDLQERYKEAVEEKKALEALITSLRSHLTRLTSELSTHQELLMELRQLRDLDFHALSEKGTEIARLTEEVERLAGEVEVLRSVVEEGLRERQIAREISMQQSVAETAPLHSDNSREVEEADEEADHIPEDKNSACDLDEILDNQDGEEGDTEPFEPYSVQSKSGSTVGQANKTVRTDHATIGSSNLAISTTSRNFEESPHYHDISAELDERRSNQSDGSLSLSRARSCSPDPRPLRPTVEVADDVVSSTSPALNLQECQRVQNASRLDSSSYYPNVSTTRHTERKGCPSQRPGFETPFPQIRGKHMERLFFSAPEHNAKACRACHRDRYHAPETWFPRHAQVTRKQSRGDDDEDEGFAEGSDESSVPPRRKSKRREHVTFSDPDHWRRVGRKAALPPQTVVARVIRELEDDFTHYKSIYCELAEQYKEMDAASDVPRRNVLARHLREVVDILEQKGDQIASLYDLLSFKDKTVPC